MVTDTENFEIDVLEKSYDKPVLVDFWAEWCGPCKMLGPVLEKLAEKYSDRFELVKLNTDNFPEIASNFGIRGIPNVKLFVEGQVAGEFTGALPESQVEDWIKKNIPGKGDKLLSDAKELIKNGKEDKASEMLKIIKQKEPDNLTVDLLLAQTILFQDPQKANELISGKEFPDNMELVNSVETISGLLSRYKSLPEGEAKAKYSDAVEYMSKKNFDKALELFIEIIRTDRPYDDDGARKACIAVFKYLGEEHPVTLKHRREFGSALYV